MRGRRLRETFNMFSDERAFRLRIFGEGVIVGTAAGSVVSAFRLALEKAEEWRPSIYAYLASKSFPGIFAGVIILTLIAFIISSLLKSEPMISGSGIPQVKGILLGRMRMNGRRVLPFKFIGGVLGIGAGLSLGREGPSVQLGAAAGQIISRVKKRTRTEERFLLTAGSGAGLAAAFNAPLAGVIFCLEELAKSFSPLVLMATIAASVSSAAIAGAFGSLEPVFHIGTLPPLPLSKYFLLIPLGVFSGLLALLFNRALTFSLDSYEKSGLRGVWRMMIPIFSAGALAFLFPYVLGGGSFLVEMIASSDPGIELLAAIFLAKFLFTMISFGSGAPGGIFLPMLVLGALSGALFSKFVLLLGIAGSDFAPNFVVYGMAAYFAGVVKSPVTGSVLIMEMTGSFHHMLALVAVSMTAYITSDMMLGEPVYEMLLSRSLSSSPAMRQAAHTRMITEFAVPQGCALDGVTIADAEWPEGCLIVDVKRGEKNLVPHGDLKLSAGDLIYALADDSDVPVIENMTHEK